MATDLTNGMFSYCYPNIITGKAHKEVDVFNFKESDVDLYDIANALSNINRYNGNTPFRYSVAQHSCYVAQLVYNRYKDARLAMGALMHDAAEAYIGDMVRPMKNTIRYVMEGMANQLSYIESFEADKYRTLYRKLMHLEDEILAVILKAFGAHLPEQIKLFDDMVAAAEVEQFYGKPIGVEPAKIEIKQIKNPYTIFLNYAIRYRSMYD